MQPADIVLLDLFEEAFARKTWHGPNLWQSLKGVTAKQAAWRTAPNRHNIWEETLHAAYWKYAVRRRLEGGKHGSFALPGSNFFPRPEAGKLTESAWKSDKALLRQEHEALRKEHESLLKEAAARFEEQSKIIKELEARSSGLHSDLTLLRRLNHRLRRQSLGEFAFRNIRIRWRLARKRSMRSTIRTLVCPIRHSSRAIRPSERSARCRQLLPARTATSSVSTPLRVSCNSARRSCSKPEAQMEVE